MDIDPDFSLLDAVSTEKDVDMPKNMSLLQNRCTKKPRKWREKCPKLIENCWKMHDFEATKTKIQPIPHQINVEMLEINSKWP